MNQADERESSYAWVIVALCFLAMAIPMGIRSTFGLLIRPWEVEFGWDRAAISLVGSIGFLSNGLARAISGRWADIYGPRVVFVGSFILMAVFTVAMGFIQSLWHVYLVFGGGLLLAAGGSANVTAAVAISRWFSRNRAFAVGVVAAGGAAGQLILLPAFAAFMERYGWRTAYFWSGAAVLFIAVPIFLLFFRDDPPEVARGEQPREGEGGRPHPLARIAREVNFWWLIGSFGICGFTTAGLIETHLIPYAEEIHIDTFTAATAFGTLGAFNALGTLISGAISDRWGHKRLLGWIYVGRAVSLFFLMFVSDPVMLFVFAVAFGLVDFATVPPTTALSTTLFGNRSGGTVFGLVFLSHQIGSAAGTYAGGLVHDLWGNYQPIFLASAMICFVAAGMSWAINEEPAPAFAEPAAG